MYAAVSKSGKARRAYPPERRAFPFNPRRRSSQARGCPTAATRRIAASSVASVALLRMLPASWRCLGFAAVQRDLLGRPRFIQLEFGSSPANEPSGAMMKSLERGRKARHPPLSIDPMTSSVRFRRSSHRACSSIWYLAPVSAVTSKVSCRSTKRETNSSYKSLRSFPSSSSRISRASASLAGSPASRGLPTR
jgi:hypothetical protein